MRKVLKIMSLAGLAVLFIATMASAQMGMSGDNQNMMSSSNSMMSDSTYNMFKQMSHNHMMMQQDLGKLKNQTSMMMNTDNMQELHAEMQAQMETMNSMQGMMSNQDMMYGNMMSMMGMGNMQGGMMNGSNGMMGSSGDPKTGKDPKATKDWSSKSTSMKDAKWNDTQKTLKQMSDNHQMLDKDFQMMQNQNAMMMKSNNLSEIRTDLKKQMAMINSMDNTMSSQDRMYKSMMAGTGMSMQEGQKMPSKTMDTNKGTMKDDKK